MGTVEGYVVPEVIEGRWWKRSVKCLIMFGIGSIQSLLARELWRCRPRLEWIFTQPVIHSQLFPLPSATCVYTFLR
jgi:hypothetical protein